MAGMSETEKAFSRSVNRLKEIVDMLLAGGYFRARMPALSPFDRVVGGMAWAVTASNADADIDIIFQENSTIGQKIKLSDSIVKALVRMKCPYALQSHQIQGLDLEKIFPVIQWLVKQVIETRAITGDLIRQYSVLQFAKQYTAFPSEVRPIAATAFVDTTITHYQPKRKYRKPVDAQFHTPDAHVEATLLEYGQKLFSSSILDLSSSAAPAGDSSSADSASLEQAVGRGKSASLAARFEQGGKAGAVGVGAKKTGVKRSAEDEAKEAAIKQAEENTRLDTVADSMDAVAGNQSRVSGQQIGKIVSLGADEIKSAADAYAEEVKLDADGNPIMVDTVSGGNGSRALEQQHTRQMENLARQLATATAKREELSTVAVQMEQKRSEAEAEVQILSSHAARLQIETEKLDVLERDQSAANREILQKLKALVSLNESLKKQEQKFKSSCKDQLQQLQDAIKKLEADDPEDADAARLKEIESIFLQDTEKYSKLRQVLAKKNQDIAAVLRQIDDIPTRAELIQYERRFVELYSLVAEKLKETRKYYALYNTLADTRTYLDREVTLLDSIQTGFPIAMKTVPGKEQFLASFSTILEGVDKTIDKVNGDMECEKAVFDAKTNGYNKLIDQQRNYFKTVKAFQEECFKNEKLTALAQDQTSEQKE